MPVYRMVKVIIQNSTDDILIASGSALLRGSWMPPAPTKDFMIEPHSTHILQAHSELVGVGVEGYVRFSTTQAYMRLTWNRPWVGKLEYGATIDSPESPAPFNISYEVEDDEPAWEHSLILTLPVVVVDSV
ncbi:MAG: hypothetical protein ETSY2_48920 [Candidatus Entotheonella gemina]|uniref:Uncharacterized protein n=1 Tax=Candidatus Entotheonella gemina TaxID=1429439 RepID=W4LB36_9BACT|nr:MAG: hypothetical protein ETSY2_48920 [Candidatus Entotheonella gemina]